MAIDDHRNNASDELACQSVPGPLQCVLDCGRCWGNYAGGGWIDTAVEPLALVTEGLIPILRTMIEVGATPNHAESFEATIKTHLSRLRAWERQHPRAERKRKDGRVEITRRGYKSIVVTSRTADDHGLTVGSEITMRDHTPRIVMESGNGIELLLGEWVNRLATPAERSELGLDPADAGAADKLARVLGGGDDNGHAKPPALPAGVAESAGPALTPSQSQVLQTMALFDASKLASTDAIAMEMDAAGRLSLRTIGPIVRRLIELRLAERPEGSRSGARLTTAGRRLASKIAD